MSSLDTAIAPSKRRKSKKSKSLSPAEAARRQRQREQSQQQNWRTAGLPPPIGHNAPVGIPRVIPFIEWCKLRGFSLSTGERLARAGKVKVTYLSPRRKGVREDHDREYLDSCTRGGA
jgi:hypothetical protein